MSLLRLRSLWLLVLVTGWCSWPGPGRCVPVTTDQESRPKVETIRKALDRPLNLEFADLTLRQAIERLREETKVNFVLDLATIQQMGFDDTDMPVSFSFQNVTVRSALRRMLSQYNLGYAIIGDSVIVTSEEMAIYRQVRQRINVDLDQVPLQAALRQLAQETATNLVLDGRVAKEAQQPVTLRLEDVPLEVAVRLMAEVAGLKPVRVGNVLFVTTKANAVELRADPDGSTPPAPAGPRDNIGITTTPRGAAGGAPPAITPAPAPAPADTKAEEKKVEKPQ